MSGQVRPASDEWVAAVYESEDEGAPLGTGVVVDPFRVLTSAHVVKKRLDSGLPLWVSFPKAVDPYGPRRAVLTVRTAKPPPADLAVLQLSEPIPAGVEVARLRSPKPADLVGLRWWAFGFPGGDPSGIGNSADGTVGEVLGQGWVRLDTDSRYLVARGFSGGGLWSPDYGDGAVVGIVGQANDRGDGRALTLYAADLAMPEEKLGELTRWGVQAAGVVALESWGWSLHTDPEAVRHWRPRARGVAVESETGYRFRGRRNALERIVAWLDREMPDRRVLIVTGSPGVGKSAVLGRVVTTADPELSAALPADDTAVKATQGSVGCAVHAKGKRALEVAREIAAAVSAPMPETVEDLAPLIRQSLIDNHRPQFNVIIDAVDEVASPTDARTILSTIVLGLVQTCADVGANLVVGTRSYDSAGNLVNRIGAAAEIVDLDDPRFSSVDDVSAYALATLQLLGAERRGNPYADAAIAAPVARRIADQAHGNYLVAGLVARTHGLYDVDPVESTALTFDANVDHAFTAYLDRVPRFHKATAAELLTPLAYAESPGFTLDLWQAALHSLTKHNLSSEDLARFAATSAATFLVQTSKTSGGGSFRLFHQALSDALVRKRLDEGQTGDEKALTRTFLTLGTRVGWADAPPYLLRSLPGHAERAGLVDDLLLKDEFLLHADLRRLIVAAVAAVSAQARDRLRLLRLSTRAIDAEPPDREAVFSVTAAIEGVPAFRTNQSGVPYRAIWAHAAPSTELTILEGHTGLVIGVCAVSVGGRDLLASTGADETVRLWDPATGAQERLLEGHTGEVFGVCAVSVGGRQLLASAGEDGTVRLWDPATGAQERLLEGHTGEVFGVCAVSVGGQQLLASTSEDRTVRLWDPATGAQERLLEGHTSGVIAVCAVSVGGRQLLASAGEDETVRLWDPATGAQERLLEGHTSGVTAVCAVSVGGRQLLASAGQDRTVRLWDPATGAQERLLEGHIGWLFGVAGVCAVSVDGRQLLASAGEDETVRLWDPATGAQERLLEGHTGLVFGVCAVSVGGRQLLASASEDETVRLWDPATGAQEQLSEGHTGWLFGVAGVCAVSVDGRQLLASAGEDETVRLWDPATGAQERLLEGHTGGVRAVCAVSVGGRQLLASAGEDGTVRLWDPATGAQERLLEGHTSGVTAVCAVSVGGRQLLASAGQDRTVRLWDPATGAQEQLLEGHTSWVEGVCAVSVGGRQLLASASSDQTVRLWDPATGAQDRLLEGHTSGVRAVCAVSVGGRQLLASASSDQTVRLWDPATGAQERLLEGHTSEVRAVCAVSMNGRELLVSASEDQTVRLWDPESGGLRRTVRLKSPVLTVSATSAGILIAGLRSTLIALHLT